MKRIAITGKITPTMRTYTIPRHKQESLTIRGSLITSVSSQHWTPNRARWSEIYLYRTNEGRYVAHQIGRSRVEGEVDLHTVDEANTLDEIREAIGEASLAQKLYTAIGANR